MAQLAHNAWASVPSVLLLPCNVPVMILLGYALGRKRIRWQTTYAVVSTAVLLAGMALTFIFFSRTAWAAVIAYVAISGVIAAGALAFVFYDARSLDYRRVAVRDFALFAVRVGVVNFVTLLNYRADLYIVGLLATAAVLGQYAVAISAAEGLLVVTQVAAVATSPHVGSMNRNEAAQLTAQCVRATLAVALAICIAFFAIAPYVVRLLYGAAYLPMVPALRILLVGVMILSIGSALSNFFTLKLGKPEVALVSQVCAALACIAVSWVLVPRIGMVGAAGASAIAYLVSAGVQIGYFVKASNIPVIALLVPTAADVKSVIALAKQSAAQGRRTVSHFAGTRAGYRSRSLDR
jgi:O-antigen/teichoic acid export membrane protein